MVQLLDKYTPSVLAHTEEVGAVEIVTEDGMEKNGLPGLEIGWGGEGEKEKEKKERRERERKKEREREKRERGERERI
jgi:hypothetical protein